MKSCRKPGETFKFLSGHEVLTTENKNTSHTYKVIRRQPGDTCSKCAFWENHCTLSMLEKRFSTGWCLRRERKVPVYFIKIKD